MKISDNNIENIFNINININGVFTNHIEQDIVSVVVALLNQQGILSGAGSGTLKEQLMELASKSESKNLNVDVPANSLIPSQFKFEGLESKIKEAIANKKSPDAAAKLETPSSSLDGQAKELMQKFIDSNPQLKL